MSSQQPSRPFFRLGSFRPMQNISQPPPPPAPAPQPSIIRPAVPRFRTPVSQTTPPQEPAPTEQPRQNGPPAAPTPPPMTETRPAVAQPLAPLTNPAPSPTPASPPPSPSLPSAVAPAPAVPRFRTPVTQTTPPQETAPTAPPRQIGRLAAPAPPPTTETRPTVAQPQAPLTNPALNSSPAPSPTSVIQTTPPSLPSAVTPAPPIVTPPLLRAPPTQPILATSKPVSPPQPRFVASSTPSSSITKTETVMQSSPQRAAAAPLAMSSPRFPTDKSAIRNSTPQSPAAPKPQTIVTSASPTIESSTLGNSLIRKSYPQPSTNPTITSPVRKVSAPSPKSKTVLGSRSPPPSEPLPTAVPASIVPDRGHTPVSSPRNGKMLSKTPPQSPLIRPLSSPPSPLTLPPAQIKTAINHELNTVPKDHTTVMTQERNGKPKIKPRVPDTYEFMETTYKYIGKDGEGKDMHKKNVEAEQSGMRVIKLVGENHGAIMELSPSHTKGNRIGTGTHNGKGNVEETSNTKNNKSMAIQAPPMTAFMNSNVQGMNNSIVYNTSCTHNDPGVHLSFSRKPNGGYINDHIMD